MSIIDSYEDPDKIQQLSNTIQIVFDIKNGQDIENKTNENEHVKLSDITHLLSQRLQKG